MPSMIYIHTYSQASMYWNVFVCVYICKDFQAEFMTDIINEIQCQTDRE